MASSQTWESSSTALMRTRRLTNPGSHVMRCSTLGSQPPSSSPANVIRPQSASYPSSRPALAASSFGLAQPVSSVATAATREATALSRAAAPRGFYRWTSSRHPTKITPAMDAQVSHGARRTVARFCAASPPFRRRQSARFITRCVPRRETKCPAARLKVPRDVSKGPSR